MTKPQDERPIELEGVPGEEDIDPADAADRLDDDPEAQPNFGDEHQRGDTAANDS
jgi:hypothetical protein